MSDELNYPAEALRCAYEQGQRDQTRAQIAHSSGGIYTAILHDLVIAQGYPPRLAVGPTLFSAFKGELERYQRFTPSQPVSATDEDGVYVHQVFRHNDFKGIVVGKTFVVE